MNKSYHVGICPAGTIVGLETVAEFNTYDDIAPTSPADTGFLHLDPYTFTCCGVVEGFEFETKNPGALEVQFWRLVSGTNYELMGTATEPCTNEDKCAKTFTGNEKITVNGSYAWGWWSADPNIVEHGTGSGDVRRVNQPGGWSVNGQYDWGTSATVLTNRIYGTRITVGPNTKPSFTTLTNGGTTLHSVTEDKGAGVSVFGISAMDPDVSDGDSLEIIMDPNTYFTYNALSASHGEVKVGNTPLGLAPEPQILQFFAYDQCHNKQNATLNITIANLPPVIHNLPSVATIPEVTNSKTFLITLNVTDYSDDIACIIQSVTPSNAFTSITSFVIDKISATEFNLSTSTSAQFRHSIATSHVVTVNCSDGTDYDAGVFTVYLTPNNPPEINNLPGSITISETVKSEVFLFWLNVTEPDSQAYTCYFGPGNSVTALSKFTVRHYANTSAFAIYTGTDVTFDTSTDPSFTLDIECSDGINDTNRNFYVYLVSNLPPNITNLPATRNLSTTAPIGFTVFTVTGTDPENDQLSYTMTCDPAACPLEIFQTGEMVLNASISDTTVVGYNINVTVFDSYRNQGAVRSLTIIITDINSMPTIDNLNNAVVLHENEGIGALVESTICTDKNVPADAITYFMSCVPATGSTVIGINSTDGKIKTVTNVNYEDAGTPKSFICTVTCSDGQASATATLSVTVVDSNEPPSFTQNAYNIDVFEGPGGKQLINSSYTFTDDDVGDTHTYRLDCGADTGYFTINATTGIISFSTMYDVDTGVRPFSVSCQLTISDGHLNDTVPVDITIRDANDNLPIFTPAIYSFRTWVGRSVGAPIGDISATDNDITAFGDLYYTLDTSLLPCDCFGVSSTGQLYVKESLYAIGVGNSVTFNVTATDGGGEKSSAPVTIVISEETTVPPVDEYWHFFDDPRSIAWFVVAIVLFVIAGGVIVYLVATAPSTPAALTKLHCQCCKLRRVFRPNRSKPSNPDTAPERSWRSMILFTHSV
ncbi:hypothetical protein ACF0H5_013093 [Mactra antiquata]